MYIKQLTEYDVERSNRGIQKKLDNREGRKHFILIHNKESNDFNEIEYVDSVMIGLYLVNFLERRRVIIYLLHLL